MLEKCNYIRIYYCCLYSYRFVMYIGDPKEAKQMAEETKRKWEERAASNEPYPCRKCGVAKHPSEFVIQRLKNEWV